MKVSDITEEIIAGWEVSFLHVQIAELEWDGLRDLLREKKSFQTLGWSEVVLQPQKWLEEENLLFNCNGLLFPGLTIALKQQHKPTKKNQPKTPTPKPTDKPKEPSVSSGSNTFFP